MIKIIKSDKNHIPQIIALAEETWKATYSNLISQEQIEFMLSQFYNKDLMLSQMENAQHHFFAMFEHENLLGYAHCIELKDIIKLSKIYFAPNMQGKGFGRQLFLKIEEHAIKLGYSKIELCVNRGNPAQLFYEKLGFIVTREEDFPIGPYWMNDYVMEKTL